MCTDRERHDQTRRRPHTGTSPRRAKEGSTDAHYTPGELPRHDATRKHPHSINNHCVGPSCELSCSSATLIESDSPLQLIRGWARGARGLLPHGYGLSFGGDGKGLEADCGDACTTP